MLSSIYRTLIIVLLLLWTPFDRLIDWFTFHSAELKADLVSEMNTDRSKLVDVFTADHKKVSLVEIYPDSRRSAEKYIVYSHGNRGNIYTNFNYFKELSAALQIGVILYDYIGYGLSENISPTENRCYDSMEAVMTYVRETLRIPETNIYLVGRSLGSGVVVDYAYKHNWTNSIILISPFKNVCTVILNCRLLLLVNKFNSYRKIKQIICPIKIIHGAKDKLIHIEHSKTLAKIIRNKSLDPVWLAAANHSNIMVAISVDHWRSAIIKLK